MEKLLFLTAIRLKYIKDLKVGRQHTPKHFTVAVIGHFMSEI